MGGKSGGIIGYRYYLGLHMVICYGPVDEIHQIRVGDRLAYDAGGDDPTLTSSQVININKPDLFGGVDREGGVGGVAQGGKVSTSGLFAELINQIAIGGTVEVAFGESTQIASTYLESRLTGNVPAYRGVLGFIFNAFYIGNNPYIKNWEFEVSRYPDLALNPATKKIGTDANPANMLLDLLTNVDWGMGYLTADIDLTSFTDAAITLHGEDFGLSMIWTASDTIENFVSSILEHINGSLYIDLASGKFVLRLIRDDYVPASLQLFDESNVVDLQSFSRRGWGETVNEITVVYHDGETNKDVPITVQDMANIQIQGTTINTTRQYPGVSNADQAMFLALRDLRTLSTPLAKVKFKVNRDAWDIAPGDVFRLSWVAFGIVDVVFRVGAVNYGNLKDGHIIIDAIEDVFGLPSSSYAKPQLSGWVEPSGPPQDAPFQFVEDATFYDIIQQIGEDDAANVAIDQAFIKAYASKPTSDHYSFQLHISPDETLALYVQEGSGEFAPSATLVAEMIGAAQTTFVYEGDLGVEFLPLLEWIQIEDELMELFNHDIVNKTMIVNRGLVDTVPAPHVIGSRFFGNQSNRAFSGVQYTDGEQVDVKILTSSGQGLLALLDATTNIHVVTNRKDKPYPPANLQLDNLPAYVPVGMTLGDLDITWEHRDRTQQTATAHIPQVFGDIGPEVGTTYTLRLYDETNTLVRTETLIAGTVFVWVDETADSGLVDRVNNNLRLELEANNSVTGLTSFQTHNYAFKRADYGYSYGEFYGGFV